MRLHWFLLQCQPGGLTRAPVPLTGSAPAAFKPASSSCVTTTRFCRGRERSLHSGHDVRHALTHTANTHTGDGIMASVSVVGQQPAPHRLDSEPPLLFIKLSGARKKIPLPRKTSWERMVFRRSSGSSGESGMAAETDSAPAPAVESSAMPGEGCVARLAPAAPRSPERDARAGCADCDRRTRESGAGIIAGDCNSNNDSDLNRNTGGRKGKTDTSVMQSRTVPNGHKRAQRPRDAPRGRRSTWSADSRHQGFSSPSSELARGESGGPPLERVTRSKSGLVRLARTEPPRREVWSIFTCGMDPRMKVETGEGHRFEAKPVTQDWCDACSRQINAQALKCQSK